MCRPFKIVVLHFSDSDSKKLPCSSLNVRNVITVKSPTRKDVLEREDRTYLGVIVTQNCRNCRVSMTMCISFFGCLKPFLAHLWCSVWKVGIGSVYETCALPRTSQSGIDTDLKIFVFVQCRLKTWAIIYYYPPSVTYK